MSLKIELWRKVIEAIETAIPEYDAVNEKVSLRRAQKARSHLMDQLKLKSDMFVLDAGMGPGTMSEVLLSKALDLTVVGLDASTRLLHAAQDRLKALYGDQVHFVQGTFEDVPFRDDSFDRIVSAYAFRDSRNRDRAIHEFYRVSENGGTFAVVDLGKPDNPLNRLFITIYVRYIIPLIARMSMSDSIKGNPWRMIFPTYQAIGTNGDLVESLKKRFTEVCLTEFSLGGVITVLARKTSERLQ